MKQLYVFFILALFFSDRFSAQQQSLLWARQVTDGQNGFCFEVIPAIGNVYTTGSFDSNICDFDPGPGTDTLMSGGQYLTRMDAQGNLVWAKHLRDTFTASLQTYAPPLSGYGDLFFPGAYPIAADAFGNVYSVGNTGYNSNYYPNGGSFISKRNAAGNRLWIKYFNGNINSYAVSNDAYGNVYVSGNFQGAVTFKPSPNAVILSGNPNTNGSNFILKLNAAGSLVWVRVLPAGNYVVSVNGNKGLSHCCDAEGNIYMNSYFSGTADFDPGPGSYTLSSGNGNMSTAYLLKLDSAGHFVWVRQFPGNVYMGFSGEVMDRNIYLSGIAIGAADLDPGPGTYSFATTDTVQFLLKLDTASHFVWAKNMGKAVTCEVCNLAIDPAGSVFMTGSFESTWDADPGPGVYNLTCAGTRDIFLLKLDSTGNFVQAFGFGSAGYDNGTGLAIDGLNDLYLTGFFRGTVDFDPGTGVSNLISNTTPNYSNGFICKFDITAITGIQQRNKEVVFNLYPDPADGACTVAFSNKDKRIIEVYSITGELLYKEINSDERVTLDLHRQNSGIYLVRVTDSHGSTITRKMIKK